ncbi:CcmD family protein [Ferruginibacter albus]|uniref:CcmD family protein n=1 Tax=Ferruginibacter albus TaxID=2875540 RepID=UPI001CC3B449|nr:CcmD family protein [Ferruginibacter albus]UAY52539.1 CcmD family protein [Ferruginibacter albus]
MRNRSLQLLLLVCSLFITVMANAQAAQPVEDTMRSSGKIYVVMAICITILVGLILYVISIDRKISKLEKNEQP